ncbi:alpha-glucuronidase family glycosyl hydrolase [Sediminibacillus massiliensis]|uniref:alpha-glucuronidase family glycosyl hydrolase n=1 Tax=Sediminibacillus massiliensis TaxID=1926277 RepID=UPI000988318C|nr:alpha-glucuronidase family glycosyl hydrolase [Sediminibacillus massiliensis]
MSISPVNTTTNKLTEAKGYNCWLQYEKITDHRLIESFLPWLSSIHVAGSSVIIDSAVEELQTAVYSMFDSEITYSDSLDASIVLGALNELDVEYFNIDNEEIENINEEGYILKSVTKGQRKTLLAAGKTDKGALYAVYHLLRIIQTGGQINNLNIIEAPKNQLRMVNQWDNIDGTIERGYSGQSIFYQNGEFTGDLQRIKDYARLLSSTGINAISINNVNVWDVETNLITEKYLPEVSKVADIFRAYGIQTFLSINYASPIQLGGLGTADPLDAEVKHFWKTKVEEIYRIVPDFGGFVVKADSENRPGPFSYNRDHADGANVLAEALEPFNGVVVWRCFVYNCRQDWRDRSTDRAKAAYDNFKPLDGKFKDNVILQVKNGPMDFQVREPVSPLFGAMPNTNQVLEFQVAQEYTGQQKDLCYLVPQWKEILDFDTYCKGEGSTVKRIVDGSLYKYKYSGIAAVSNIGDDINWTGNTLAQANLYGYGRLTWNPDLSSQEITNEWILQTFGNDPEVHEVVYRMLMDSWPVYENYNAPLGVGWMINPGHHYGPNVDGYEYSAWGTYHFSDRDGIGVDRTVESGTAYTAQYFSPNFETYNNLETCPDELLLFFHHVPYTHQLKSGKTVIQHIYDTHFKGVDQVRELIERWESIEGKIDEYRYNNIRNRFDLQLTNAREWRDKVNTYFYRKSGISDEHNRTIY